MFGCFWGHKFGKITDDGYQYCGRCGLATKPSPPHPCANGHQWETESSLGYTGYDTWGEGHWRDWKLAQVCKRCNQRQTIWQFGH